MAQVPKEFPLQATAYEVKEEVGAGQSGKVFRGFCPSVGEEVAIKILDLEDSSVSFTSVINEIRVLRNNSHQNLIRMHAAFVEGTKLWLIMQYANAGSVLDIMRYARPNGLDEPLIATVLKYVLRAMDYFHSKNQIHRDLKCGNILLDMQGNAYVSDMGVSSSLLENGAMVKKRQTFVGSPYWMAPEVLEQVHGYDYKADIWSLGITALELAHGRGPYVDMPKMKVLYEVLNKPSPTLQEDKQQKYSQHFKEFCNLCLNKNPSQRPTAKALLEHKFIKNNARNGPYLANNLLKNLKSLEARFAELQIGMEQHILESFVSQEPPAGEPTAPATPVAPLAAAAVTPAAEKNTESSGGDGAEATLESDQKVSNRRGRFTVDEDQGGDSGNQAAEATGDSSTSKLKPVPLPNNSWIFDEQGKEQMEKVRMEALKEAGGGDDDQEDGVIKKGRFIVDESGSHDGGAVTSQPEVPLRAASEAGKEKKEGSRFVVTDVPSTEGKGGNEGDLVERKGRFQVETSGGGNVGTTSAVEGNAAAIVCSADLHATVKKLSSLVSAYTQQQDAAIQPWKEKVQSLEATNETLRAEKESLNKVVLTLEAQVKQLQEQLALQQATPIATTPVAPSREASASDLSTPRQNPQAVMESLSSQQVLQQHTAVRQVIPAQQQPPSK